MGQEVHIHQELAALGDLVRKSMLTFQIWFKWQKCVENRIIARSRREAFTPEGKPAEKWEIRYLPSGRIDMVRQAIG